MEYWPVAESAAEEVRHLDYLGLVAVILRITCDVEYADFVLYCLDQVAPVSFCRIVFQILFFSFFFPYIPTSCAFT